MSWFRAILFVGALLTGPAAIAADDETRLTGLIEINDSMFDRPYADQSENPTIIRAPELVGNGENSYYSWNYNPALFPDNPASTFVVFAKLEVEIDGTPASCEPIKVSRTASGQVSEIAVTSEPAKVACDLIKQRVRFRHALAETGKPAVVATKLRVLFQPDWQPLVVPAMPKVSEREMRRRKFRDMMPGEVLPRSGNWPINHIGPAMISLTVPDWREHVGPDRTMPKSASVGVVLAFTPSGEVSECTIIATAPWNSRAISSMVALGAMAPSNQPP